MSRWVSETEISQHLGYKILIAGLSEAGKTAVKRIFFLKQQTEDVNKLSATINYERLSLTVNDSPVTIVDLGGQKIFLKRFLTGFSPFVFSNVKIFIFLIDVANKTSRNNAIQYFTSCIEKLKTFSPETNVFVFLHKNDLIRNRPNYESIHEQLKEQFQLEYKDSPLRFFRTTIFRPESVIDSFGRIFELTIPELTKSDFVEGREIGEIEEYHTTPMTLIEPKEEIVRKVPIAPITQKMAGDPEVLQKLQFIMKHALKTENGAPNENKVFLGKAASEESISETVLAHTEIPHIRELEIEQNLDISEPVDEDTTVLNQFAQVDPTKLTHLINFYQIEAENAAELIENEWDQLFEMAVTSGMPVPLVLDIFLKYLPFIRKSQGEEKTKTFDTNKLLELFSTYLKGELREENIVKCLVLAVEKPNLSIREINTKYLIQEVEPRKIKEMITKPAEVAHMEIPIEVESSDGFIALPNTQGMGFKVDLIEDGLNAKISFQLQSRMGHKEMIGSSLVSADATVDEILYILAYEQNLSGIGVFEDGILSMQFGAKIIHESIRQLKLRQKSSTLEVETKRTRSEGGILADTLEFIIPMEIESDGAYIFLPDSDKVAFNLEKAKRGFILSFSQRGFPIGQAHIVETIQEKQLEKLLKEAMQIPIESEGSLRFASRIILTSIYNHLKPKKEVLITQEATDKKDQTSDKLKEYLSLLSKDELF
ncbi:ADP-ribosylation factor-like protein [Candidatus Hodarchaeum mangrovi]